MPVHESDVCIIGAGITSAMLAQKLSELRPGLSITVVEAGRSIFDLENRARYRAQMLKYEQNPWPEDFIPDQWGEGQISRTMAVGGQALHWGGACNRFSEEDLRLHSKYGLYVDWPLEWTDLEKHYCDAERRMGVSGAPSPFTKNRQSVPYPMPPMELSFDLAELKKWGDKSGYPFQGIPQAKNTVAYDGRSKCFRCGTCEICPTGAKYSPDFTFKKLLAEKKITLHDHTLVRKLVLDSANSKVASAQATSLNKGDEAFEYRAGVFVIASGYTWSPHLLLLSACSAFPNGLANKTGQVGKYSNGHAFISATVELDREILPDMNPMYGLISRQFFRCESDKPYVRHDLRIWSQSGKPARLQDEQGNILLGDDVLTDWRTRNKRGVARVRAYCDVHPAEDSSVTLDPSHRNHLGDPMPKIVHVYNSETIDRMPQTKKHVADVFAQLAQADNGKVLRVSEGQYLDHPAGGCRMGTDPATSVCDSYGRTHDHQNLFVVGAPTMPTAGCTNGTLTFVALTLRSADQIGGQFRGAGQKPAAS